MYRKRNLIEVYRELVPHPTDGNFSDITGLLFGRLHVIGYVGSLPNGVSLWLCHCDCGKDTVVEKGSLTRSKGYTRSCGCLAAETASVRNRTHGFKKSAIYDIYIGMIRRCTDETCRSWKDYGGRGIVVCERWINSIADFSSDMPPFPGEGYSIDRIDNDGNYSCGQCLDCIAHGWIANCHWATDIEQANNSRHNRAITFNGKTQSLSLWCRELAIPYDRTRSRLNRGQSIEEAFTQRRMRNAPATL